MGLRISMLRGWSGEKILTIWPPTHRQLTEGGGDPEQLDIASMSEAAMAP